MKCVFPGSFDPVTLGHMDLIRRGASLVDELIVVVMENGEKSRLFSLDERMKMLKTALAGMEGVRVDSHEGMLVDCVRAFGADAVLRGVRGVRDYEYERDMAEINARLGGVETLFLPAAAELVCVSSSAVREICRFGGDVSGFVPQAALDLMAKSLRDRSI